MNGGALVGVVMGSDSDWPVMEAAVAALDEFGVPYEADVVSAHRMPHEMIGSERRRTRILAVGGSNEHFQREERLERRDTGIGVDAPQALRLGACQTESDRAFIPKRVGERISAPLHLVPGSSLS